MEAEGKEAEEETTDPKESPECRKNTSVKAQGITKRFFALPCLDLWIFKLTPTPRPTPVTSVRVTNIHNL